MAAAQNDFQGRLNEALSTHQLAGQTFSQLLRDLADAGRVGAVQVQQDASARIEAAQKAHDAAIKALQDKHQAEVSLLFKTTEEAKAKLSEAQAMASASLAQSAESLKQITAERDALKVSLEAIQGTPEWKAKRAANAKADMQKAQAIIEARQKELSTLGVS
jgi:hypothetical protein